MRQDCLRRRVVPDIQDAMLCLRIQRSPRAVSALLDGAEGNNTRDLMSALSPELGPDAARFLRFFSRIASECSAFGVDQHHRAVSLDAPEVWVYERHRDREARERNRSTPPAQLITAANAVRRDGKRPARDAFQAVATADV